MTLHPSNKKLSVKPGERVSIQLHNESVAFGGIVEEVKGEYIWLRASDEPFALIKRFNLKIDQVFKSN